MTRPEDLLSDSLRDRVDHRELPSTPIGDVVSTARRIRRRRRLRTGVVTAAVFAVLAAPFVVSTTRNTDSSIGPTVPSSTESAVPVRLADVALGEPPPSVAWIDGRDYVAGDGTRTTLPFDNIVRVAPYRGTFLVVVSGDLHVIWLNDDLSGAAARWCGQGSLFVSDDGGSTAFAVSKATSRCREDADFTLHLGSAQPSSTGDQTRPMPIHDAALVGILGNAVVASPYNEGSPALVDIDGSSTTIDQLVHVEGVNTRLGLVSGQLAGGMTEWLTGAVLDPVTRSVSWVKPGWTLFTFSPDGSMVLGVQPGAGKPLDWALSDAESGKQLHEFTTPDGFRFSKVMWEDDEHLLMAATQGHTQAILRTTLDGSIQLATKAAPYDDDAQVSRYALAPNAFP